MTADFQSYPVYESDETPWLGDLPRRWQARRIRTIAELRVSNVDKKQNEGELPVRLCNYVDVYKNSRITDTIRFMHATATYQEIEHFRLHLHDVIITKDSETWNDIAVPSLVQYTAPDLVCGYHLAMLRPREDVISGPYLFRALQAQDIATQLHVSANGVTRFGLSRGDIKSAMIPVPPLDEQSAIVRFLDYADRLIGRYILAKQKLIKLLEDQRQAIINQAVTGGFRQQARFKPSDSMWFEDIPEHWHVARLRNIIADRIRNGLYKGREQYGEGGTPIIQMGDAFASPIIERCATDRVYLSPEEKDRWSLRPGDLLFARRSIVLEGSGKCSLVGELPETHVFESSLIRVRLDLRRVVPEFAYLFFKSSYSRSQVLAVTKQVTISGIDGTQLKALTVLVPPIAEQAWIVSEAKRRFAPIDLSIKKVTDEIKLGREYRTRLIADVVTGRIDVREAAVNLPKEPEETEDLSAVDEVLASGTRAKPAFQDLAEEEVIA